MNRPTRIIVATVVGIALSRVMPPKQDIQADAQTPVLQPIVVTALDRAPAFKWSAPNTPYLESMRSRFDLDDVTATARTDYDRVRAVSKWVQNQAEPAAKPEPASVDAMEILVDVTEGDGDYDCDEAAVAISGALNAVGMPARVVHLKTADSETRAIGAGHAIAEAYLRDAKRWVMIDGQWDMIPLVKGKPANALELKRALDAKSGAITYSSNSGTQPAEYNRWIHQYMYYMDTKLDQRVGVPTEARSIMLVPQGARAPKVFQKRQPIRNMIYTTVPAFFYPTPAAAPTPRPVPSAASASAASRAKPLAAARVTAGNAG